VQSRTETLTGGNWRSRGDGGGNWQGDRHAWRGQGGGGQVQTWNGQSVQVPQQHNWSGGNWQGQSGNPSARNRNYTDPNRNSTYRGANRYSGGDSRWRDDRGWNGNRGWNNGSRWGYGNNYGSWNRGWRHDNRYDWSDYRRYHPDVYRLGRYYAPYRNYSYRRLGIGFYLDSLFYGSDYWIDDPWSYRLPEVYGPYRWVRYYDDAVLVDIYSGEVVDVIYDFFW
jgi:hypothetical protein